MISGKITRQSTTDDDLLCLLGISQWVFNSNCGFIMEMIDKEHHGNSEESWFSFLGLTAGKLKNYKNLMYEVLGDEIYNLFSDFVTKRNAIAHSLPTGKKVDGYAISIYRNDVTIEIDKPYLLDFIQQNEKLCDLIYAKRGY